MCCETMAILSQHERQLVAEAVMEAWCWLEHAGLIRPQPQTSSDSWHVSRRGRKLRDKSDFEAYRKASLLPMQLLHPTIAEKIRAPFERGEYDHAYSSPSEKSS
jgi:hypothetical protein